MTFANLPHMKNYPGHFQLYVHAHVSVLSIVELICERYGGTLRNVSIYCVTKSGEKVKLNPHDKLQDCGFTGGPRPEPQLVELLYDYETEFRDCPLLMCDHYFT